MKSKGEGNMKNAFCILMALLLLTSPAWAEEVTVSGGTFNDGWEVKDNNRVFYEIFVGSYSDSNGDGIGDIRGIINRMDYLNDGDPQSGKSLGIEGIWMTPVFLSPSYHKYDVTDYYQIDPTFGTEEDLKELVTLCHERDVKLIMDLPLNHTGANNRWFRDFKNAQLAGNKADPYYDFYSWIGMDDPVPAGRRFRKVYDARLQVEANFSDDMPELNLDNEQVRQTLLDVAAYWMNLGVDGFRFDAAKYIYLNDHDKNAEFWKWYIGELKKINPEVYTVAEVWDSESTILRYAGSVDCFRFSASQAEGLIASTAKGGNVNRFTADTQQYLDEIHSIRQDAMNIFFIANHDTDRAAGFLTLATQRMQMAANLYLLSPGSPFIYYGEEIGLRGSRGAAATDANRRLAMRWGDGDTVQDPEGSNYASQTEDTVAGMLQNEKSLLNYYKRLLMIRKANPEIARGEYTALFFPDSNAGGFLCTWKGKTAAVFHNPGKKEVTLDLSEATNLMFTQIAAVIGKKSASYEDGVLTLGSQTSVILK